MVTSTDALTPSHVTVAVSGCGTGALTLPEVGTACVWPSAESVQDVAPVLPQVSVVEAPADATGFGFALTVTVTAGGGGGGGGGSTVTSTTTPADERQVYDRATPSAFAASTQASSDACRLTMDVPRYSGQSPGVTVAVTAASASDGASNSKARSFFIKRTGSGQWWRRWSAS